MCDRLDTVGHLLEQQQPVTSDGIDAFAPDQATLEQCERGRQTFLENLFSIMSQGTAEIATKDTRERFESVIETLATED